MSKWTVLVLPKQKDYTYRVINVTFKYSNKQFNKVQKGDKVFYILHKYTYDDLVFHDCVAFADGELAGVEVGSPVENVIPESVYSTAFEFDGKTYKAKKLIFRQLTMWQISEKNCIRMDFTAMVLSMYDLSVVLDQVVLVSACS